MNTSATLIPPTGLFPALLPVPPVTGERGLVAAEHHRRGQGGGRRGCAQAAEQRLLQAGRMSSVQAASRGWTRCAKAHPPGAARHQVPAALAGVPHLAAARPCRPG